MRRFLDQEITGPTKELLLLKSFLTKDSRQETKCQLVVKLMLPTNMPNVILLL